MVAVMMMVRSLPVRVHRSIKDFRVQFREFSSDVVSAVEFIGALVARAFDLAIVHSVRTAACADGGEHRRDDRAHDANGHRELRRRVRPSCLIDDAAERCPRSQQLLCRIHEVSRPRP